MRNPNLGSVANAIRIVKLFRLHPTLSVTEVSQELNVAKSTAHRLLSTLVAEGFAERDPLKRVYHPGSMLVSVGLAAMGSFDVQRRANAPIHRLAGHLGETVKLSVAQGQFTRCVQSVQIDNSLQVGGGVGLLLPITATAAGKVLLMDRTEQEIRQLFPAGLPAVTEQTVVDVDELMVELQLVRKRNWASNCEESTLGIEGLAVPVMGLANHVVASLAVAVPTVRMNPERRTRIVAALLQTADQMRTNSDAAPPDRTHPHDALPRAINGI